MTGTPFAHPLLILNCHVCHPTVHYPHCPTRLGSSRDNDNDTMDAKAKERRQHKTEKEQVRLEEEQKRQEEERRHEVERVAEVAWVEANHVERQQVVEEITTEASRKRVWAESGPMSSVKAR